MIPLFRCEMWPKCTLKMEGKRAENVPFLVFLSSVIIQFLVLFFSFFHLIKSNSSPPFTSTFPPSPPFLSVQTKQALCPFLLSVLLLRFNLNAPLALRFPNKNRPWPPRLVNSTLLWFKRIVIEAKCRPFYSRKGLILQRFLCSEKKWESSTWQRRAWEVKRKGIFFEENKTSEEREKTTL